MIGIGVIGAGYWGPKHVRNFSDIPRARVVSVADLSLPRLSLIQEQYPATRTTTDFGQLLHDPEVDAVVIATPVSTHARLAEEALLAGKSVLVEKPLATSSSDCERLIRIAAGVDRVLMVGHTFVHNPAVHMLRDLVMSGEIGEIYSAYAQRLNLGLFQRDINVLWDLAPHDISILMYLFGESPLAVAARGRAHVRPGIEDTAYMHLAFPSCASASIHVSWLDPHKVRRLTLIGSKKMVVYDDTEQVEKIRIYDKGVDVLPRDSGDITLTYRSGEMVAPPVPGDEPLRLECEQFLDCIESGALPTSDGAQGMVVVQALDAAAQSLAAYGALISMPDALVPVYSGDAGGTLRPIDVALVAAGD